MVEDQGRVLDSCPTSTAPSCWPPRCHVCLLFCIRNFTVISAVGPTRGQEHYVYLPSHCTYVTMAGKGCSLCVVRVTPPEPAKPPPTASELPPLFLSLRLGAAYSTPSVTNTTYHGACLDDILIHHYGGIRGAVNEPSPTNSQPSKLIEAKPFPRRKHASTLRSCPDIITDELNSCPED
ncbi:hypothetical protein EDC04DRAFT_2661656 [Pisolithus marmoratus]|nr:hypothetical protein EDC04DRAFT_2661656 [Pisolithus marmoratus]